MNRHENTKLNNEEFSRGETILKSYPTVLFVELTQNCNLSCFMCRASKGYQQELNMSDEIFNKLKSELFPLAHTIDLRGYGESTILKKFNDKLDETALSGAKIRLVTNALAIKKSLWTQLMSNNTTVVVSVDSANEMTMKNLGRGDFEQLKKSIKIGITEREKYGFKGVIYFNTVVSSYNINELCEIIKFAKSYNVDRITMFPVVANKENPLNLMYSENELKDALTRATITAKKVDIELRLGASLSDSLVLDKGLPEKCSHPWEYCYIDYAGNVGYCDHLIGHKALMLGNLNNTSFTDIWNNNKFQQLRAEHNKARKGGTEEMQFNLPHCNWCYKRRYIDFEEETNVNAKSRIISTSSCDNLFTPKTNIIKETQFLKGRNLPFKKLNNL